MTARTQRRTKVTHRGKPRAVPYARVSSKEQEKEGFSIPAQLKLRRAYAESADLVVAQEFIDVETAKQTGRAGFGEMVAFFDQTPGCRVLLVEKTDRLYRNWKDWVTLDDLDLGDPFRQGKRRALQRLAFLREVHARHQSVDGQELH